MQRVSLLRPVGPVIHTRAVSRYMKSGEEISIIPTEVDVIGPVLLVVFLSIQTD